MAERTYRRDRNGRNAALVETYDDEWGLVTTTIYVPVLVIEDRKTCFCCSCGERAGNDPSCRNHGWYSVRPCVRHGSPGQEDDDGKMPSSVEEALARLARLAGS